MLSKKLLFITATFFIVLIIGLFGRLLKRGKNGVINVLVVISTLLMITNFAATPAHAVCPVCTVAVGGGLAISRYLGIDDLIVSVWIGGLALSMTLTIATFISKKFKLQKRISIPLSFVLLYGLLFFTLDALNITGLTLNKIWGIDRIVAGTIIGTVIFSLAAKLHFYIKKANGDKVYFPFQKVVIPVTALGLVSLVLYILTK